MDSPRPSPSSASIGPNPEPTGLFQSLDANRILSTTRRLGQRIRERFPDSGLTRVAGELVAVTERVRGTEAFLATPVGWLRTTTALLVAGLVIVVLAGGWFTLADRVTPYSSLAEFLQGLDAAVNNVVFVGLAIYFLLSLETRWKRRRALASLHTLRALAHIIDLHQLTKDPDRARPGLGQRHRDRTRDTPSSPERHFTAFELTRYLDYCAEMLSLLGKLAALHGQHFDDPVTLSAVNDIENLTSDLARKIWQKILVLDRMVASEPPGPPDRRG